MNALSIRSLGKRYGTTQALDGLDLDIARGSRTAVIGPSGSGKTTLLRLIAGFEAPDAGEICLDGQVIANATGGVPAHRRNIGLVMQEGALFPHLSVLENIRFGIRDRADAEARALELMDIVELERSMARRQPHQLSGGQQQRVALARALARQPRVMLLDEPFSALDTGLRDQLRNATAKILADAGIATLLVTHDQDEAMSFADQLVILREGRLVQAGRPRDLYVAPADAGTAEFLGPAILFDAEVRDGHAHCVLGSIPLVGSQRNLAGRATLLLRPEQLLLSTSLAPDAVVWRLADAQFAGPSVRIALELLSNTPDSATDSVLVFETSARDLPPQGTRIAIAVSGPGYVLAHAPQL